MIPHYLNLVLLFGIAFGFQAFALLQAFKLGDLVCLDGLSEKLPTYTPQDKTRTALRFIILCVLLVAAQCAAVVAFIIFLGAAR